MLNTIGVIFNNKMINHSIIKNLNYRKYSLNNCHLIVKQFLFKIGQHVSPFILNNAVDKQDLHELHVLSY